MSDKIDFIKHTFVLQQGQSDCSPACLASIIKYHGGHKSLEEIKRKLEQQKQEQSF